MVSGQLYYTISGEELFVFEKKEFRIYVGSGVSQTTKIYLFVVRRVTIV